MGAQRWRILLLDDRSAITRALGRRMRAGGHVVHTLPTPESGAPLLVLSAPDVPEPSDQAPEAFEPLEERLRMPHDVPAG